MQIIQKAQDKNRDLWLLKLVGKYKYLGRSTLTRILTDFNPAGNYYIIT